MLKLTEARFDTADAQLVPEAGSCATCPKRTGFDPDLFADVDAPDLCTDTACYQDKQDANTAIIIAKARARGMEVIEGKEAQELKPFHYGHPKGFTDLDHTIYDGAKGADVPLRDVIGKNALHGQVKLFIDPHDGRAVEVIPDELAATARAEMRQAVQKPHDDAEELHDREEQARHRLAEQYEQRWRAPAVAAIQSGLGNGMVTCFDVPMLRAILRMLATHDDVDEELADELLQVAPEVDFWDAVDAAIQAIPDGELGARICTLLLRVEADKLVDWQTSGIRHLRTITATPVIEALAITCQVDLQAIKADVQDAMRAEAAGN